MTYPVRRRQRLPGYDYSTPGYYFVTVCVRDRLPLLGKVATGEMQRSPAGDLVMRLCEELPHRYLGVALDVVMVMPEHLHAIFFLDGETLSLSEIMHHFKSRSTAEYAARVRAEGWPRFNGTLWQRGFYDRVIRREAELMRAREYILQNPLRWSLAHERDDGR